MLLLLVLYIHVLACASFYVVSIVEKWVPNQDFIYYETQIFDSPTSTKYWLSVYHAVQLFTVDEMAASTDLELFFAAIAMLISSVITANIFGVIAILFQNLNAPTVRFEKQMDSANTVMEAMQLPKHIQKEVSKYLHFTRETQERQQELNCLLRRVSPSIRFKIQQSMF